MAQGFIRPGKPEAERPYHYTQCGLDDIYLLNGYRIHNTAHGTGVSVEDVEGLHQAVGDHIARSKGQLSGKEIRFLRKLMDLTQAELGLLLGVDVQTVARWEKGQTSIHGSADRMIRLLFMAHKDGAVDVVETANILAHLDSTEAPQYFLETDDGWRSAA